MCRFAATAEGNTLAYALSALQVCVQHYRETEQGAIEASLMADVMQHFEAVNASVAKAALEVFIQLNRKQRVNISDVFLKFAQSVRFALYVETCCRVSLIA